MKTSNFLLPGQEAWVFETETGYDYLGRVQWMSYPDGEKLFYVYDKGGAIKSVYGMKFIGRYDYVKQMAYGDTWNSVGRQTVFSEGEIVELNRCIGLNSGTIINIPQTTNIKA